jgi:phosphoglycolate phosphatase-like HAD superfamily hydrolase
MNQKAEPMHNPLCLFDVDGTLVHVREDIAFGAAFRDLHGPDIDLNWVAEYMVSDAAFVDAVLRRVGLAPSEVERNAVLHRFVSLLRTGIEVGELPVRPVRGAMEFVTRLACSHPLGLSTGCVEPSARAKLAAVGLSDIFPCGGFSVGERSRAELLVRAIEAAARHYERAFAPADVVFFGDGPWDVEAARQVGVRFLGVNEHEPIRNRLRLAGARDVLVDYSDVSSVLAALATAAPPATG